MDPETLLICDAEGPVALAGIMGGLDSEVTPETRRVLIESAYFNPPPSGAPASAWGSAPRPPTASSGAWTRTG